MLKISECIDLKTFHTRRGSGFSPRTIKRWIEYGYLKPGKHFLRNYSGKIFIHPESFDKAIAELNK